MLLYRLSDDRIRFVMMYTGVLDKSAIGLSMFCALHCLAICGDHGASARGVLVRWGGLSSNVNLLGAAHEHRRYWPRLQASWFLWGHLLGADWLADVDFCCAIRARHLRRNGRKNSDPVGWNVCYDGAYPQFPLVPELRLRSLDLSGAAGQRR